MALTPEKARTFPHPPHPHGMVLIYIQKYWKETDSGHQNRTRSLPESIPTITAETEEIVVLTRQERPREKGGPEMHQIK